MVQTVKSLLIVVVVGYLAGVFIFKWDPAGLILKHGEEAEAVAKVLDPSFQPRTAEETRELARHFIRPGVEIEAIEDRFQTVGANMGPLFKTTLLVGETKYRQFAFELGHGVTAYVLIETFAQRVAQHSQCLKLDEPH
jgi:hypothetical protein